ncbi:hypothetical protein N658DRAFT_188805 [Parathielavia hyrcaniae]|uniref:Uncharacterized protein n=1 Tax=Parathielavia hyrcaniae TaxID=113614 RepID=A0AAN6Q711_9PEZI|nr:hypothetical protein N658DRAFT_188805 [Parathielavia hyrcaniae]
MIKVDLNGVVVPASSCEPTLDPRPFDPNGVLRFDPPGSFFFSFLCLSLSLSPAVAIVDYFLCREKMPRTVSGSVVVWVASEPR